MLTSRRTAVAPATAAAAIVATDVGQPGAGLDGHIPSLALKLLPGAEASVANTAAVPAMAPARVPRRADAEREHHESALTKLPLR